MEDKSFVLFIRALYMQKELSKYTPISDLILMSKIEDTIYEHFKRYGV